MAQSVRNSAVRTSIVSADEPLIVNGQSVDRNGPSLFTPVEEQLGLRLDTARAAVDVLVIDHVEKPTPD